MIRAARAAGMPFAWFTADEEFGQNPGLCDYLEGSRIPYVMAVPKNTQFTDTAGRLTQVYDLRVKLTADRGTRSIWRREPWRSVAPWSGSKAKVCGLKPKPKSRAGYRKLRLPSWAVKMLLRRQIDATPNEWGVVFTSPNGMLRDPSNAQADLRDVFARLDYPWVTSHVFRKTAAILLDEAGGSARKIADQLGHSQVSLTQDFYMAQDRLGGCGPGVGDHR